MRRAICFGALLCALPALAWAGSPSGKQASKSTSQREGLVALALRSEARGDAAARAELLEDALKASPDDATARWHSGQVRVGDAWMKADAVAEQANEDRRLAEYRKIRDDYPDTVEGQLELAGWCSRRGLEDQKRAHLTKVLELNPNHAGARRELGFRWVEGVWLSAEERQASAERADQAAESLTDWSPKLIKLREALDRRSLRHREIALERLKEIKDPAAIPALESVLGAHSEDAALALVDVLGQIEGVDAATALARQAVFSPSEQVRTEAAAKLHARPYEEFVPVLLGSLHTPLQSRFELFVRPGGRLLYQHSFYRESQNERQQQTFAVDYSRRNEDGTIDLGRLAMAQRQFARLAEERERQAAAQEAYNTELTTRVSTVLAMATGEPMKEKADDWWNWWNERNEITYDTAKPLREDYRPEYYDIVDRPEPVIPVNATPSLVGVVMRGTPGRIASECLAAGTPIWTELGPVAVEQIRVGDRVLSQNPDSGELTYKPVLRTTVRPSGKLLSIDAGPAGKLDCSGGHVFWVAGQGWLRARKLEPGMMLHTLDGPVELREVKEGPEAETYNLVVADFHSYFTATGKWLSHDFTPQSATTSIVPGLAKASQ
jgi:Tfp pilus assembly protein PilF